MEEVVHLVHLGGNAQVDGTVADLDNETTADIWVDLKSQRISIMIFPVQNLSFNTYLWCDLQLLALANILALANSRLQLLHNLVVQRCGRCDSQLNLALRRADQLRKLLAHALEDAQTVVLGKGVEEVGDGVGLVLDAGGLLELLHNLLLVLDGKSGRLDDAGELGVLLEGLVQAVNGLGDVVEGGGLGGGGVLPMAVSVGDCGIAHRELPYQGAGVGAVDAEDLDRRPGVCSCCCGLCGGFGEGAGGSDVESWCCHAG